MGPREVPVFSSRRGIASADVGLLAGRCLTEQAESTRRWEHLARVGTGTRPWAAEQGWGWEWGGLAMVMLTVASPPAGREETPALGTEAPGLLPQRLGISW